MNQKKLVVFEWSTWTGGLIGNLPSVEVPRKCCVDPDRVRAVTQDGARDRTSILLDGGVSVSVDLPLDQVIEKLGFVAVENHATLA